MEGRRATPFINIIRAFFLLLDVLRTAERRRVKGKDEETARKMGVDDQD